MSWAGRTEGSKVREKENDKVSMVPVHSCETLSIQGYWHQPLSMQECEQGDFLKTTWQYVSRTLKKLLNIVTQ